MKKFIFPDKKKLINQTARLKTTNKLGMYIAISCGIVIVLMFGFGGLSNAVVQDDKNSLTNKIKPNLDIKVNEDIIKPKSFAINSINNNEIQVNKKDDINFNKILEQERQERESISNKNIDEKLNNSITDSDRYSASPDIPVANNINTLDVKNNNSINAQLPNLNTINQALQDMQNINTKGVDNNSQQQKIKFASSSGNFGYLNSIKQNAISEKEIKAGTVIPAILNHSLNSDLPGIVTATVSQDVYDSISHTNIVIPKGTKLNGIYDSNLSFGQDGLAVVWNRLVFTDGATFDIGSMTGADQGGNSGFRDRVNNHYARTFGSSILVALIGSGMQLSQPKNRSLAGNDAQETITANIAEQTGNTAQNVLNKTLNVQPTVTIRAGYRFNIMVNKDFIVEN
ncbi:MAG: conjugal transfer protein TrbI [Pseudomonadota bacterium]|jgi:type IV secretion system protein VirB10